MELILQFACLVLLCVACGLLGYAAGLRKVEKTNAKPQPLSPIAAAIARAEPLVTLRRPDEITEIIDMSEIWPDPQLGSESDRTAVYDASRYRKPQNLPPPPAVATRACEAQSLSRS